MRKDSYFHVRKDYVIGTISSDSFYFATHNITRVHDVSYSRTAIDLRVAIYELERAFARSEKKCEYYLFAEGSVGTLLNMVARLLR